MTYYEVTMQHNADSLLALSRMQYDLFCTRNRIVRTILSAILVIIGVFLLLYKYIQIYPHNRAI